MIPRRYRKTADHATLWVTMKSILELDPIGLICKDAGYRELQKTSIDRRKHVCKSVVQSGRKQVIVIPNLDSPLNEENLGACLWKFFP